MLPRLSPQILFYRQQSRALIDAADALLQEPLTHILAILSFSLGITTLCTMTAIVWGLESIPVPALGPTIAIMSTLNFFSVGLILFYSIRLAMHRAAHDIAIHHLIGSPPMSIQSPFFYRGLLIGFLSACASCISLSILMLKTPLLDPLLTVITFPVLMLLIVGLAMAIGGIAALLALWRESTLC